MTVKVRSKRLRDGKRQALFLDCYHQGRRSRRHLGLYLTGDRKKREEDRETLRLAEDIAAKRRLELASEEHGFALQAKQKADFIEYCRKLGKSKRSPNTRAVWRNAIGHLEAFACGPMQFGKINHSVLQAFREYLLGKVNQNSAVVYLARIKTACRQAVKDGILTRSPALDVSIKKQATRRQFLTLQELEKLAAMPCSNAETKAAFLFSAFSGLRYSDVKALVWSQVKRENGGCFLEFSQTKTGEPETLPLSAEAAAILEGQQNACFSPRITSAFNGDVVFKLGAQQTIDKAIRRWVKGAEIGKKISFHNARHTFATLSLTHGVDIYTVSKLLGHKRLETTEIYAKVIDEKKRQAVAMLPRLNGNGQGSEGREQ
jgi:integrase